MRLRESKSAVAAAVALCAVVSGLAASCDIDKFYVHMGGNVGDDALALGCLEPNGCGLVSFSPAGCACGPECTTPLATNMSQGELVSVTLNSSLADGDGVCSDAQVSVVATGEINKSNPLVRATLFGRKFALAGIRDTDGESQCGVYAFRDTVVDLHVHNVTSGERLATPQQTLQVSAHSMGTFTSIVAADTLNTMSASDDVLVTCWSNPNRTDVFLSRRIDYHALAPLSEEAVFGWASSRGFLTHLDCETLDAEPEGFSCASSVNSSSAKCLGTTPQSTTTPTFTQLFNGLAYLGPSIVINAPSAGRCVAATSYADGDGGSSTQFLPTDLFSSFFTIGADVDRIAVLSSGPEPVTCTVSDANGTLATTIITAGLDELRVANHRVSNELAASAGDVVSCDGQALIVVNPAIDGNEFTLQGLLADALWEDFQDAQCPLESDEDEEIDDNEDDNEDDNVLDAIADGFENLSTEGIVAIGCVLGALFLLFASVCILRRRQRRKKNNRLSNKSGLAPLKLANSNDRFENPAQPLNMMDTLGLTHGALPALPSPASGERYSDTLKVDRDHTL